MPAAATVESLAAARPDEAPSCPCCDGTESTTFVEFPALRFSRCATCGAVFRNRERADLLPNDFYEQSYFHGRKSGRDRRFEHRVKKAMRQIRTLLRVRPLTRLLDVGCSFGYVIEAGQRLGLASAGVDISEYAVDVCRQRGYRCEVGTLDALPFPPQAFDGIVVRHTLEHTATPRNALANIARLLEPGGVALVVVPDLDYWKGLLLRRTYRYFRPDDLGQQHCVYYSEASLRRLLEKSGFQVKASNKAVRPLEAGADKGLGARLRFLLARPFLALGAALHLRRELYFVVQKA